MKIHYNSKLTEFARELRNHPTESEKMLWIFLKGDQLGYDFHRQKPIGFYIADFFCYKLKLVIELDGITHHDLSVQYKDAKKTEYLEGKGITVLRFMDEEVIYETEHVMAAIRKFINEYEDNIDTPSVSPPL